MIQLAVVLLAAEPRLPKAEMIFRGPRDWVLTDGGGQVLQHFEKLGGLEPQEIALSPDGIVMAFLARTPEGHLGLYKWDGNDATPLTDHLGYFAAPTFSPSGQEIVFAHNPGPQSGAVGQHGTGQNAQLWIVKLNGSELRQLTDTPGCKGPSTFSGQKTLFFTHNSCSGNFSLEAFTLKERGEGSVRQFTARDSYTSQPRASPDGRRVAYSAAWYHDTRVMLAESDAPRSARVVAVANGGVRSLGLQWSSDSRFLFYVAGATLHRIEINHDRDTAVTSLGDAR